MIQTTKKETKIKKKLKSTTTPQNTNNKSSNQSQTKYSHTVWFVFVLIASILHAKERQNSRFHLSWSTWVGFPN